MPPSASFVLNGPTQLMNPPLRPAMRKLLITGGAGFLGVNAAAHFVEAGWNVVLLDNLSRANTDRNLAWAKGRYGSAIGFLREDVRDRAALDRAVIGADAILHLAAQVAVTTSLDDPETDFDINARGTLNLLEAVRAHAPQAAVIYASTNKVYGELVGVGEPIDERRSLDFHSPYGCSKGAADQYVIDYARCFGLKTMVLRQSCIYGAHQYGTEDQGWVAHFVWAILAGRPITIYGDGSQVRDLLDARDLCRVYATAIEGIDDYAGRVFNVGGGPANTRSLLEAIKDIERLSGHSARYTFAGWRAGDQRHYVSDIGLAERLLGWRPQIGFEQGLAELIAWVRSTTDSTAVAA